MLTYRFLFLQAIHSVEATSSLYVFLPFFRDGEMKVQRDFENNSVEYHASILAIR